MKDITKEPRSEVELLRLEKRAREMGGDTWKTFILMRYAGMHPRVIFPYDYREKNQKEYNLREEDGEITLKLGFKKKIRMIVWNRPKKKGAKAYTSLPKHPNIDFDVGEYARRIKTNKNRYKRSTNYARWLIKQLGEAVTPPIHDLSPLSLRHSLAVEMKKKGVPDNVICDTLNISLKTLRTYARFVTSDRHNEYMRAMGIE